jgi:hypothetical protein
MQAQVPQFVEREAKVAGPLTFRQALFVGTGFILCAFLWFTVAPKNFLLFLFLVFLITLATVSLAFARVYGKTLPRVIIDIFDFLGSPRVYIWKKKLIAPKIVIKTALLPEKSAEKESPLKVSEKSRINNLAVKLEIGTKEF